MTNVNDLTWQKNTTIKDLTDQYETLGFQSTKLHKASDVFIKMQKHNATTYLTFTSNMATSGLRGFFAQLINLGIADVIITTTGAIEEDIMKSFGEDFTIGDYNADDVELHEQGRNRVGNLHIDNESYMKFDDWINNQLHQIYQDDHRLTVSTLLNHLGKPLDDENSILNQARQNDVPIFCPSITDGALGFHLYLFQKEHPDFTIDVVNDFGTILKTTTHDEQKGIIALGGGTSKHHAILSTLLKGGANYAVYMTTSRETSGSMSGATTDEAKSWGKVKDDSDVATVIGDVTITFPIAMMRSLDILDEEGFI